MVYDQYEYKAYGTSKIHLAEGWYTRKDLEDILAAMSRVAAANAKSMEPLE